MGRDKKIVELTPQETTLKARVDDEAHYWYILAWEDSMSKDWKETLNRMSKPWVAILHNKDVNIYTGEKVKNHYHIFIDMGGTTKRSAMIKYREDINGTSLLARSDKYGALDYLTHKNHPQKTQYTIDDLIFGKMKESVKKKLLEDDGIDKNVVFATSIDLMKEHGIKTMRQYFELLKSDKTGLPENERQMLYAFARGNDFHKLNSILASDNTIRKYGVERAVMIEKEDLKKEEKKIEKKIVPQEFEKEIEEVEQKYGIRMPRSIKITKEMLENVKIDFEGEDIMAGFRKLEEEDIMAGFRELEEQEKNKK